MMTETATPRCESLAWNALRQAQYGAGAFTLTGLRMNDQVGTAALLVAEFASKRSNLTVTIAGRQPASGTRVRGVTIVRSAA